ncbi:MAG: transporter [Rhizobacter sp.]|nr:transporter [Rhizobacter sp.]
MKRFKSVAAAFMIAAASVAAHAQTFPTKPIWMVTPFTSGGATGLLARSLGDRFTAAWGQPVLVDGRPSAGGIVATQVVANAPPDGYSILIATANLSIAPFLYKTLPYDTDTALTPIIEIVTVPNVIVARATLPVNTLSDLIALAKAQPGKLNYATPGVGSFPHLVAEMFKHDAGISLTHIPYKGTPAALVALLGGEVDMLSSNLSDVLSQIRAGKIKALAVTGKERFAALPDVPTVAEAGVPGFSAVGWMGLFAPRNTPAAVIDKLNHEANAALADPKMKGWLREQGFETVGGSAAQFAEFLKTDRQRWGEVVKYSGATAE